MGDFAGMEPDGVRRLANALGELAGKTSLLKQSLAESIAEAGSDWAGGPGLAALDRTWQFANGTAEDLRWRLELLLRLEGKAADFGGFISGTLPFSSRREAGAAGRARGAEGRRLWEAYQADRSEANLAALREWMRGLGGVEAMDPAYAAALLTAMGRQNLQALIEHNTAEMSPGEGLRPEQLEHVASDLRPVAQLVASAEAGAMLPADIRANLLNELTPAGLAALIGLADQPASLLKPAAHRLIGDVRTEGAGPVFDWNVYWTVAALSRNTEAARAVFTNKADLAVLTHPRLLLGPAPPEMRQRLTQTIDRVMTPAEGEPRQAPGERSQVFMNLVDIFADKTYWPTVSQTPGLAPVLAERSAPYFPQLAGIAAAANESRPDVHPRGAWNQVTVDEAGRFYAALSRDPTAVDIVGEGYRAYLNDLDWSGAHPYGNADQRIRFEQVSIRAGGLGAVLVDGLSQADLDADQRREATAMLLTSAVGASMSGMVEKVGGDAAPIIEKAIEEASLAAAQNWITSTLGGDDDQAVTAMGELITQQKETINAELARQGLEKLNDSDVRRLTNELQGQYLEAMIRALERRGG